MMNMAIRFSIRHKSLVGVSPWSLKQHLSTATMPSVLSTPIGIPEQWLQRRFRSLSANIQDAILHNVRSLTDRELLTFATLCSGSDCPVVWFMAFIRMVKAESYFVALDHPRASSFLGCRHLFSCEIKPDKRLWLTKNIMPQLLFEDICSLGQDEAWDILSGALVRVPHADAVPAECMRGMKWFEVHLNCSCSSRAAVSIAQYRSCINCLTLVERGGAWMCGVSV